MSAWHNVMVEDPVEGQVYDVWTKQHGRLINCEPRNGAWYKITDRGDFTEMIDITSAEVTHFMEPPEPPNN